VNWKRATEEQPKTDEEILVGQAGEFFIAVYSSSEGIFHCKNGTEIGLKNDVIWAYIVPPKG
jgi:hypothetical protein